MGITDWLGQMETNEALGKVFIKIKRYFQKNKAKNIEIIVIVKLKPKTI